MSVVIWSQTFTITTSLGSIEIPPALLDPTQCAMGINIRSANASAPGGDGTIMGPQFKDGYQIHIVVNLLDDGGNWLLGADLQSFYDELTSHLEAMVEANGRIQWNVMGDGPPPDRMLDRVRTLEMPGVSGGMLPKSLPFTLQCPRPHAMDAPETDTDLTDSTPVTVSRGGTAKGFRAVAEVYGPCDTFELKNTTSGLKVSYDSSRPGAVALGGSDYAEIDFLAETVTLNGNDGFLEEGVVWEDTDFWDLLPGDNAIELDGADGQLKWNVPWA